MVVLTGGQLDVASGVPWSVLVLALLFGVVVAMLAAAYPPDREPYLLVRAVQYE